MLKSKTSLAKKTPRKSTSDDPVERWARDVEAGRTVAGPHIRNAAQRHLEDRKHESERGLHWDLKAAKHAIDFFPDVLRLAKGKFQGVPFHLEPSQQFVIGSLFGWKWRATGKRRFRRAFIEQGKGNGKSPMAAGIGMYCLLADDEKGAEVFAAASMKEQAQVCFQAAVDMWRQSPALTDALTPSGGNPIWNLAHLPSGSYFRPISGEGGRGKSGPIPSCALCDEVHEMRDGNVIEMLERGFKSREQPLLVMITNSGSDLNSVCWEEHVNAIRAAAGSSALDGRDGQVTDYVGDPDVAATYDDTFSFVCSLDADDDPLNDPSCWIKANPLLGVTQPVAEIERAVRQAKAMPGKMNNILRLHFCIWTQSDKAWMARETLEGVLADFDPAEELAGEKVYGGIDLSGSQDITALAFVSRTGEIDMPTEDGGTVRKPTFDAWIEAWTPGDTIVERASRDKAPYDVWARQGHLRAPPGKQIRLDFVAVEIARVAAEFQLEWLAYDRYAYAKLADELDAAGVEVRQVEHPQGGKRRGKAPEDVLEGAKQDEREPPLGLWMPASLGMLETLILEKRIRLRINPVLISAIMSSAIEEDAFGNRWFSKRKATNRIDAVVAVAMAIGVATAEWDGEFGSVYTGERGLIAFG